MFFLTNARNKCGAGQTGLLSRCSPSSNVTLVYKNFLDKEIVPSYRYTFFANLCLFRRGTLADPTCLRREAALNEMHASCFLLVPLMPVAHPLRPRSNSNLLKTPDNKIIISPQ